MREVYANNPALLAQDLRTMARSLEKRGLPGAEALMLDAAERIESPWLPIATAPRERSVGLRGAMILGCCARGTVAKTFWLEEGGGLWMLPTGKGLETWNPVLWTHLPAEHQDRDGVSARVRRALQECDT